MPIIINSLLVSTVVILVVFFVRTRRQNQQQRLENAFKKQQLDDAFYQLLREQNSCISLIQLTEAARVDVQQARQYLDYQVEMLGAVPEVDADGDTFYRFPKLRRPQRADSSSRDR